MRRPSSKPMWPKLSRYLFAITLCVLMVVPCPARGKELRVCADPDYMPFSNRAGEGFENKIAELTAKTLGVQLVYTWASNRGAGGFGEFLSRNLDAGKCDAVMEMPYGSYNLGNLWRRLGLRVCKPLGVGATLNQNSKCKSQFTVKRK